MGEKGAKMTANSAETTEMLVSTFEPLGTISSKKMFGGHGIFSDSQMFAIVNSDGHPYLKVDDDLRAELESAGGHQHGKMPYYSISENILSNPDELLRLAKKSILVSKK